MRPEDIVKAHLDKDTLEVDKGKINENRPEFVKFRNKNFYIWGDV